MEANIAKAEAFLAEQKKKKQEFDFPAVSVNGGAAIFRSKTAQAEEEDFDNAFGVVRGHLATVADREEKVDSI